MLTALIHSAQTLPGRSIGATMQGTAFCNAYNILRVVASGPGITGHGEHGILVQQHASDQYIQPRECIP
jgi:hypothetical protein